MNQYIRSFLIGNLFALNFFTAKHGNEIDILKIRIINCRNEIDNLKIKINNKK